MKHLLFSEKLISLLSKLDIKLSYVLDGFHLDCFLSLYHALNVPAFILFPDSLFDNVLKYLSVLHKDPLVVFVPPEDVGGGGPPGFVRENLFHIQRSRELLSSGPGSVSFIVCSNSGLGVPLIGSEPQHELKFSSNTSFDDCFTFFSAHNYSCVDVVLNPGEYCVRGGLLDVFPFSSAGPVRLNFLDGGVSVCEFDIQSQLTGRQINNFSIVSLIKQDLLPLGACDLPGFLYLYFNTVERINIVRPVGFSKELTCLSFEEFSQRGDLDPVNVHVDEALSSIGVMDYLGNFFIPPWFINALPVVSSYQERFDYIPLNISNIKKGDYLVHQNHGVGVCLGLQTYNKDNGPIREFLSIKYEDGGIIRLDTGHLDLVDYYASADTDGVSLDSLQKLSGWSRKRRAAHRQAEDTVEHLLNMYVRRNDLSRSAFIPCVDMENKFLDDFPYKDTEDQITVWKEISDDLSSSVPMDRLLCGDVGFGKTEIAMRAAFRVVLSGLRVVVLAPTTILANQLYASFRDRLGIHAVNVELVSRFRSLKKIKAVQKKILLENNDVLVGTHSILNDDIYLKNIGLLIIDEEHRFGVKHKEKIKCFKESVDVLSMSATPIPRSLNLTLAGIYSISLLQTPPLMRLPIITRIDYFNENLICSAISFEAERGGGVYFVHNNVQSIKSVTDRLRVLLPRFSILFIHGQEPPKEIEKKMDLFSSGDIHVLVCTSIIEAGIDVPNANCIIINNSHLFGLSQLYQIRGRVGRGHLQAYAYLLIPRGVKLSSKAFGRIKTIEENIRLGSGFNISRSDMMLRGSGSLFGYKQSGGSGSVGYEMYLRLIHRVLHESGKLKTKFIVLPEDVFIEIFEHRYIPEDYISVDDLRLSFYKNLSSAIDENEINNILYQITNRFGPPPPPLNNLLQEYRLRLMAASAGVLSIRARGCGLVCKITQNNSPEFIAAALEYIQQFLDGRNVDFHLLPLPGPGLSVCFHISHGTDKYSFFSSFLDKFGALP